MAPSKKQGANKDGDKGKKANRAKNNDSKAKKENTKHAPVTKPGTKFNWVDNTHINQRHFKAGESKRKGELKMSLKSTDGKKHRFDFKQPEGDWDDPRFISKVNNWRRQIFRRRLNKDGDNNVFRSPWTEKEKASVRDLIKEKIKKSGSNRFSAADWDEIAQQHNSKFRGKKLSPNENLAAAKSHRSGELSGKGKKLGEGASRPLPDRSAAAIIGMVNRWPDVREIFHGQLSTTGASEDPLSTSEEEEQNTDTDSSLTDLSDFFDSDDDETIGGNVPGKTTNSGTLITAF